MRDGVTMPAQKFGAEFKFGVLAGAMIALASLASYRLFQSIPYPPGPDQEEYLAAGRSFAEHFVFFWKAPLYSAWLGIFHLLSGGNQQVCFFIEKAVSVLLLALLVAYLGRRLFDTRTGLLLGVWVVNCKYLIWEVNNSHTLTACLLVAGALCLFLPNQRARVPLALLAVFLSAQVRAEMMLPLAALIGYVLWSLGKRLIKRADAASIFDVHALRWWVGCGALALALLLLFASRQGGEAKYELANEAFAQNFAANYVDRFGLHERYPHPWGAAHEIMGNVMPGAQSLTEAVIHHPREVVAHVLFNVKISLRALPANVLGFTQRWLMAAIFVFYLASFWLWPQRDSYRARWAALPEETKRMLVVWALGSSLLVLNTYVFRVAARYYIQLIPVQTILIVFVLRAAVEWWQRGRQTSLQHAAQPARPLA